VAIDEHGRALAQTGGLTAAGVKMAAVNGGKANLTNDLSNTHPIGFDYVAIRTHRNANAHGTTDPTTGDGEIVDPNYTFATKVVPTTNTFANQGVYNAVTRNSTTGNGAKKIKDVLYGGTIMTCASCHEVHNKENATQEAYNGTNKYVGDNGLTGKAPNYFLWAKEKDSLICLSCHVK
jgi:hypothetical protein